MSHLNIQVEKAEWYTPFQAYGKGKDRRAIELRIRVNDVMYASVKYSLEKALDSISFDIQKNTGLDLSSVLSKLVL